MPKVRHGHLIGVREAEGEVHLRALARRLDWRCSFRRRYICAGFCTCSIISSIFRSNNQASSFSDNRSL